MPSQPTPCQHSAHSRRGEKALIAALCLTVFFMIVEFIGGWMSNSLALIADALHMLADSGTLLLSLVIVWITQRPSNQKMSFGYHRAEVLGALGSGLLIWAMVGVLVYEAIQRIGSPPQVAGTTVILIAFIGLIVNLLTMKILHGPHHESLNLRAAYLHVFGDLLGSIAAVISGVVIWKWGWMFIDPLVTFLSATIILWSSWGLVIESVEVLMQSTPREIDLEELEKDLLSIAGVEEVHRLHVWSLSSEAKAMSVHLVSRDHDRVLSLAQERLDQKYSIQHTTIQIENPDRFKSQRCQSSPA